MIKSPFFDASPMEWLQASLTPAKFIEVTVLPQQTLDALYPAYGLGPNGDNVVRFLKDLAVWAETATDEEAAILEEMKAANRKYVSIAMPAIAADHLYAAIPPRPDTRHSRSIWGSGVWTAMTIACDAFYDDLEGATRWRDRYLEVYGFGANEYKWRGVIS